MDVVRSALGGAFDSNPLEGIDWSPAFFAFLVYTWTIITYKFQLGTASMAVALLALPLEQKGMKMPPLAFMMFGLVIWALIGMMVTDYPDLVVDATTDFAKVGAVVFVGLNVLTSRARIRAYVVLMIIEWGLFPMRGTLISFFVLHGAVQGRAAWNFIYSNPNDLAGLCILALSVALGMIAVEKRKWVQLGGRIAVGTLVLIIILTQSRGGFIAMGAFALVGGRKFFTNIKTILSIALLCVAVVAIAPNSVWRRFSTIKDATNTDMSYLDADETDLATRQDQSSSVQRLAIWDVALTIIQQNPLTGVGLGAYPEAHFQTWRRGHFPSISFGRRDTHSTYLNLGAEMGIPGLLLFLGMMGYTAVNSRKVRLENAARAPALATQMYYLEIGLFGYLVAAIWGTYGNMIPTYTYLIIMTAITQAMKESAGPQVMRGAQPKASARQRQMSGARA